MKNIITIKSLQTMALLHKQSKPVSFTSYPCPEWYLIQGTDNRQRGPS